MTTTGRSLTQTFKHVWSDDPALDKDALDADVYAAFLDDGDASKLPVRPGCELMVFECKPLSAKARHRVLDVWQTKPASAYLEAVQLSIVGWTGFAGVSGTMPAPKMQQIGNAQMLHDDAVEEINDPLLINELGMRILNWSALRPTSGRGSR
jgi:hypothetical protein